MRFPRSPSALQRPGVEDLPMTYTGTQNEHAGLRGLTRWEHAAWACVTAQQGGEGTELMQGKSFR